MRIAILGSNKLKISQNVAAGPETFIYTFVNKFLSRSDGYQLTVFASGDSDLPVKIESINEISSMEDKDIGENWHKLYEFSLLSKAFSKPIILIYITLISVTEKSLCLLLTLSKNRFLLPFIAD